MRDACQRGIDQLKQAGVQTGSYRALRFLNISPKRKKVVMAYEVARSRIVEYRHHRDQISSEFMALFDTGLSIARKEYESACETRDRAARLLSAMFVDCDAILTPAAPGEAPHGLDATGDPLFSRGWNLLQVPCVSIPFWRRSKWAAAVFSINWKGWC